MPFFLEYSINGEDVHSLEVERDFALRLDSQLVELMDEGAAKLINTPQYGLMVVNFGKFVHARLVERAASPKIRGGRQL